jgi:hypothetical protein
LPADQVATCCASVIKPMLQREPTDTEAANLSDLTAVAERCLAQHPDDGLAYVGAAPGWPFEGGRRSRRIQRESAADDLTGSSRRRYG